MPEDSKKSLNPIIVGFRERKTQLVAHIHDELAAGKTMQDLHGLNTQGEFWHKVLRGGPPCTSVGPDYEKIRAIINLFLEKCPVLRVKKEGEPPIPLKDAQIFERELEDILCGDRAMPVPMAKVVSYLTELKREDLLILALLATENTPASENKALAGDIRNLMKSHEPPITKTAIRDRAVTSKRKGVLAFPEYWLSRMPESLQPLHMIMLGLEENGVPRGTGEEMKELACLPKPERKAFTPQTLAQLASKWRIPYNTETGCVLPAFHEVLGRLKTTPMPVAELLYALRTARDMDLAVSDCVMSMKIPDSRYEVYERPTDRQKPLPASIEIEKLIQFYDRTLQERKLPGLNEDERELMDTGLKKPYPNGISATAARGPRGDGWISFTRRPSPETTPGTRSA